MSEYTINKETFNKICKKQKNILNDSLKSLPQEEFTLSKVQEMVSKSFRFRNLHSLQSFFENEITHPLKT